MVIYNSESRVINACPIIPISENKYLSFQLYNVAEALYESPFYWFLGDKKYKSKAFENRGEFTESFAYERLKLVFGEARVFKNIVLLDSKGNEVGEIDVLVIYADRAIVVQAKSKKLTIEARKGNDNYLRGDFQKAVQDAYDQAHSCSLLIEDQKYQCCDKSHNEISIPREFKEIYIFCVVSDHYPALSFQSRQFLEYAEGEKIRHPFVMDIFLLDAMTEMLQSPLYFLSYIHRRSMYGLKILSSNELTILSYHLRYNLDVDEEIGMLVLGEDISVNLDVAMTVRREGLPGKRVPEGILTRFNGTLIEDIIHQLDAAETIFSVNLGFFFLRLAEQTLLDISQGIENAIKKSRTDHATHDLTVGVDSLKCGLTVYASYESQRTVLEKLKSHCEVRKYRQKADVWFGLCLDPRSEKIRFGVELGVKWEHDAEMESLVRALKLQGRKRIRPTRMKAKKTGRNEKCPCGSGLKYKRCCLK